MEARREEPPPRVRALPLYGRDRELEDLLADLREAAGGQGMLRLVVGEAGIGKSALLHALRHRAEERGVLCLWANCWDGGGAPAYWPWVQVLRALAERGPDPELPPGPGLAHLVALVPELAGVLGTPVEAPGADPEGNRFVLFDAAARLLLAAGAQVPLLIVLDDLHCADQPSLAWLDFLTAQLGAAHLLVVGAHREAAEARDPEVAAHLARLAEHGRPLTLGGLDEEATANLVDARSAGEGDPQLARRLHRLTGGNPFFCDELLALMATHGEHGGAHDAMPLPSGVRATLRRRLRALPEPTLEALRAGAVLGPEFRLAALAGTLGGEPAAALESLEAGLQAGLIVPCGGPTGTRYAFRHALVRTAVYEELDAARRMRLHAAAARALERVYGPAAEPHLAELAHHHLASAALGGAAAGIDAALGAARRATGFAAHEDAIALLLRAGEAAELLDAADHRHAELAVALGEVHIRAGDVPAARTALEKAVALARQAGDGPTMGRAALAAALWGFSAGQVDQELVAMLREALELLAREEGDAHAALRARVMARLASLLYWSDTEAERMELGREAVALARRAGDAPALAFAIAHAGLASWSPDRTEEHLVVCDEALSLCAQTGDLELQVMLHSWRWNLLAELDDLAGAAAASAACVTLARELGQPRAAWYEPLHEGASAMLVGDFPRAEERNAAAAAVGAAVEGSIAVPMAIAQQCLMRLSQGRGEEIEPILRAASAAYPAMPAWRCGLAALSAELGRTDEAARELARLTRDGLGVLPRDNLWLLGTTFLAQTCVRVGDRECGGLVYDALLPFAERNVVSPNAAIVGPVHRYLASLAALCGAYDRAAGHARAARERARATGAGPTLVHLDLEEAAWRRVRGGEGDAALARELEERATTRAHELGMEAVVEHHAAAAPAAAPPAPAIASAPAAPAAALGREGEVWTFTLADRAVRLKDSKGLRHLAILLARPGDEVHALDLVAAVEGEAGASAAPGAGEAAVQAGLTARAGSDAGALLDDRAKAAYRERVDELRAEIEEAEAFGDAERSERAHTELEFLLDELRRAVGLGGRDRRAASDAERARVNVTRAVRGAIRRVAERDEELGALLQRTVRTGTFCAYEPDPAAPPGWAVSP